MTGFCPRCGNETGPFVKGFCVDCFLLQKEVVPVPKEIELAVCKHCRKVRFTSTWLVQSEEKLEKFLVSKLKVKELLQPNVSVLFSFPFEREQQIKFIVVGQIDSAELSFERDALLKPKGMTCDKCSKLFGNYFEATIQFRFEQNDPVLLEQKVLKAQKIFEQLKKKDSLASIVKMSFDRKGVDLVVGSNKAAKKVVAIMANESKQKAIATKSLHSLNKLTSRNIYRYTYCLRF